MLVISLRSTTVIFGEISLSGALRPVNQTENRLKEAKKLGFSRAVAPTQENQTGLRDMRQEKVVDLASFVSGMFQEGKR